MKNKIPLAIIIAAFIIGAFIFAGFYITNKNDIGDNSRTTGKTISIQFDDEGVVTKVIDGDTVIVNGENVRLLGIDSDEKGYPCYSSAKDRIEELLLSKEVQLEKDVEDKDQYGRYLRYIFLESKNINLQMVEEGLAIARFYPQNVKYKEEIISAEQEAREDKIGCKWSGTTQVAQTLSTDGQNVQWKSLLGAAIGACSAGNYMNQEKIIEGMIVDVYKSKTNTLFINFEKPYPNSCFTAVVFSSDLYKFPENPEDYFENKLVRVKGLIKEYEGEPEIILENMDQIEVAV